MSRLSKIVNNVPIQVQNRSGFDMSHEHFFTATPGTLIPAACIEVLPNDSIKLGHLTHVKLPPMATDFYGRLDARIEAFFVPNRLLYGGWQSFISSINEENDEAAIPVSPYIPQIDAIDTEEQLPYALQVGSLADYLGFKSFDYTDMNRPISALPFLAYHRIWNDWYRDSRIQKPCFCDKSVDDTTDPVFHVHAFRAANLPTYHIPVEGQYKITTIEDTTIEGGDFQTNDKLYDGKSLFDLRQRNYSKDLFTAATLSPQYGNESSVQFQVDDDGKGQFTIAALRAANSLQKFLERNNIAGTRYIDQIKAHFGVVPADATLQRPLYLGGTTLGVYNKSVVQTTPYRSGDVSNNVYSGLGAKVANPSALGDDMLVNDFHATEHGFIMVMFSLVPHAVYSNGVSPVLNHSQVGDFAFPILAGMGDEALLARDLNQESDDSVFGYVQRYANYKYLLDRVSGLFRLSEELGAFCLQRNIAKNPTLSSSFLEIPTTCLDGITSGVGDSDTSVSMVDMYFNLKMVRALPVYSLPTLADEKDVHTVIMDNGGFRL